MKTPLPRGSAPRLALAALTASLTLLPAAPVPAGALAIPTNPDNPAVAEQWANPAVRATEGERARVALVSAPTTADVNLPLRIRVRVTNTSSDTLSGVEVTPRRGPATGSVEDSRAAAVADIGEYAVVGRARGVDKLLRPGESTELDLDIAREEIPLAAGASYPLMIVAADEAQVLDTERFQLSVRPADPANPADTADDAQRAQVSALFPVTAAVDIVPGETGSAPDAPRLVLSSEHLADQLSPGGRLTELMGVYADATADPAVAAASCLALDPALVDTVERMSHGYTVAESRPDVVEEPKRLRDSWGSTDTAESEAAGRGAADAAAFLEKVRAIAATGCVVALPWANADLNAVARTGDSWLVREAIERGPFTLSRVLGTTGVENVVIPPAGYVEPDAAASLGWADHADSPLTDGGLSPAWEEKHAPNATVEQGASTVQHVDHPRAVLDSPDVPGPAGAAAPAPHNPVRVIVARGTVDTGATEKTAKPGPSDAATRYAWIAPGVMAVQFQDSLASTLAALGPHPVTTAYSPVHQRYDYARDSALARAISAGSAVRVAAATAGAGETVLVSPPAGWDAEDAATIMGAVRDALADSAHPIGLADALAGAGDAPAGVSVGAAQPDPSAYTDSEVLTASQQARFIEEFTSLLVNDPAIALGRYGFTLPLRRDLLTALGTPGRSARDEYPAAVEATRSRLAGSRDMLNELRRAVTLIPPGNVYTRTSPSSPLLIVAQNGLPLPLDATILYSAPPGVRLHVPPTVRIPAHGSYTVQMTADLPENKPTDIKLFLASRQGVPVSQAVDISVRTAGIALPGWMLLAGMALILALLLLLSIARTRASRPARTRRRPRPRPPQRNAPPPKPPPMPPTETTHPPT